MSMHTKRGRTTRGLFRDQRGTASVEAAMMLPVMGLCWIGLFFRLATIDGTLVAATEARRAAWVSSNNACRGEDTEYECDENESAAGGGGNESGGGGGWLDALTDVPIIGGLFGSLLGYSMTAHAGRTVARPNVFGGGTVNAGYHYYIMCNEEPMTVDEMLIATLCGQLGDAISWLITCPPPRHTEVPAGCGL
jgi:hypothetical protein